jgi:acyl-CoA thioester hydrolase
MDTPLTATSSAPATGTLSEPFRYLFRVRYGECDAQQVVFNARYADYVDLAGTEFWRAVLGGYHALLAQGLDTQVVRLLIEWQSPARFDDVLCARVSVTRLGHTSFTLSVGFARAADDTAVATAEVVYVLVDARTFVKQALPDSLREQLRVGAPGMVVNHAGS